MKHAKPRHRPLRAIPDDAHELPEQEGEAIDWASLRPLERSPGRPQYTTPMELLSESLPGETLTPEARAARASQWVLLARGSGRFA